MRTETTMTASCLIGGCEGKHEARGLCRKHYTRMRRHGDPHKTKVLMAPRGAKLRFVISAIDNPGDSCIIWPFRTSKRYAEVRYEGRDRQAHRLALCLFTDTPLSTPLQAIHGPCHNRLCINPKHLSFGTRDQNMSDRLRDGTDARGEKSVRAKLTKEKVLSIRKDSRPQTEIAAEYKVACSTVSHIKAGRGWAWLGERE